MKGFFKDALGFLIVWVLIFFVLFATIPRRYYASYEYDLQSIIYKKLQTGNQTGNVIIGDSKTQLGLDARLLHATNYSLGGTSPVEGYYQLRMLLQNNTNHIDTVFISYALSHLISQYFFYTGSYYNGIINTGYLDSVRSVAKATNDSIYAMRHSDFSTYLDLKMDNPWLSARVRLVREFVIGGLNSCYAYLLQPHNAKGISGNSQLMYGRVTGLSTDSVIYKRTHESNHAAELLSMKPSETDKIYLQKMVTLCKEHGVLPFFILTPDPQSAADPLLQKEVGVLKGVFGQHFAYDTSAYTDENFRDDVGHMNIYGINRFQGFILKRLYGDGTITTSKR